MTHRYPAAICPLQDLGALHFSGPEAHHFLQGQVSNDLTRLAPGSILRAGLHNSQGRVLALLWLAALSGTDVLALLPRELAPAMAAHLRRYLLRAKVTLSDASAQYRVFGIQAGDAAHTWPEARLYEGSRRILIQTASEPAPAGEPMSREQWRALDIAAGIAQVYAPTSGQFVAQMLNLDCIDAISFSKGCYTGQEVIARAHYRGRVKRRMQRFETGSSQPLTPGEVGQFEDARAFRVVDCVVRADGWREFLGVAPLPGAAHEAEDARTGGAARALAARALPLPYELPE
jgi:folate-binding protein YgfZ